VFQLILRILNVANKGMNGGLLVILMKTLCCILNIKRIIFWEIPQNINFSILNWRFCFFKKWRLLVSYKVVYLQFLQTWYEFFTNSSDVDVTVSRLHLLVGSHWLNVIAPVMLHSSIPCKSTCSTCSTGHCVQLFIRQSSVSGLQLINAKRFLNVDTFFSGSFLWAVHLAWLHQPWVWYSDVERVHKQNKFQQPQQELHFSVEADKIWRRQS
jgi:hypothetical protein